MTRLANDPLAFPDDAVAGLVAANPARLRRVHGGVARTTPTPDGQVAVVLGGGSGHYPAFAGWVGEGMAHAAVCGNIFSSPSASQVHAVCRAAEAGGGVVLGFGNYAGDVLHFGRAAETLRSEGVDVRIVRVTDDIASGPADTPLNRRGIAGDLTVFKVAGAAAEAGYDLDRVEQVANHANDRTRSLGVAFSGCTLPGADAPLFTVPERTIALGLGIHGEPGISEAPLGTAADVADQLVDGVLAEEPARGEGGYTGRVAVLLNGLGATKYEELFVTYRRVAERLAAAGLTVVAPEVGEHVTSLDMAGVSLTAMFLDEELERLWTAPLDTVAWRHGDVSAAISAPADLAAVTTPAPPATAPVREGDPASRELAAKVTEVLRVLAGTVTEHEKYLGELDQVAGDGDHGQGMLLGATAAARAAERALAEGAGARTLLRVAGDAWSEGAGGTSGALWGAALTATGAAVSDDEGATDAALVDALCAGADAVTRIGGAQVGDKTMVDALVPFRQTLARAFATDADLVAAWTTAAAAATTAAADTADLTARLGRARTHGEHSLGHPDPGATSFALVVAAAAVHLKGARA